MRKLCKRNSALLVVAALLSISSAYSADNKVSADEHHQDKTPKRTQPYYPSRSPEAEGLLNRFADRNYLYKFTVEVYPKVSKASLISNNTAKYVGLDEQGNLILVESNADKLKKALAILNGNPPTKDQVESKTDQDLGYFTDPNKTETKNNIVVIKGIKFKRVALAALVCQNYELLFQDRSLFSALLLSLYHVVIYNHPNEIKLNRKNDDRPIISVVEDDLTTAVARLKQQNQNAKIACVVAADAENVGGGHLDGVTGTIEESIVYVTPHLSPILGLVAELHGYPLPKHGGMYVPNQMIMRDYNTYQLLAEGVPVNYIFSVGIDLRENRSFAETAEYDPLLLDIILCQAKIAAVYENEILVTGPFSCGVFGNKPAKIIEIYKKVIEKYLVGTSVKQVVFSVIDGPKPTRLNWKKEEVPNENAQFYTAFSGTGEIS